MVAAASALAIVLVYCVAGCMRMGGGALAAATLSPLLGAHAYAQVAAAASNLSSILPLAVLLLVACASAAVFQCAHPQITLMYKPSGYMARIPARCPSLLRGFRPSPWLVNGHLMTLSVLFRKCPCIMYSRELVPTPDGGQVSLDWVSRTMEHAHAHAPAHAGACAGEGSDDVAGCTQPVLLLLHGLTGGSHEAYVSDMATLAHDECGMRVVVLNCRSCAHSSLLTPTSYHAAWTHDLRHVVALLHARFPAAPLLALGFSLGANILCNYLGEERYTHTHALSHTHSLSHTL